MKYRKLDAVIVVNSLVYFLLAYYLVVFSSNLFIILLAKIIGFDAELSYKGFTLSGEKWSDNNIILVYFFGNLISLFMAIFFQRLYNIERKYTKRIKIFYLWVYIISLNWFMGEIIIGAIFKTGIRSALVAFHVPSFFRLLLALLGVFGLIYFGIKSQKHVRVSSNLYFTSLSSQKTIPFFIKQMLIPSLLGTIIIILLKLPNLGQYHYVDLYMILLSIYLFIAGLFIRTGSLKSITFKSYKPNNNTIANSKYNLSYTPLVILFLVLLILRIGLMNGISF